ncbi:DUF805 domain-containing protein [Lapidilactobacillus bayanensis]|uniref:DUF805 domain-containing protein n=1 Tax=Lapidilactobacillus bayanensis TaxID=2485998 RepID=UPI000F77707E|nr:DUF805 domain-containing protein [Lapidilactobacillus bayanensis]
MKQINEQPGQVSFGQAFKDYWRGYVEFRGRTTRAGYWWMTLLTSVWSIFLGDFFIVALFSSGLFNIFDNDTNVSYGPLIIAAILVVLSFLVLLLPNLALRVRRYRDAGLRGRGFLVLWAISVVVQVAGNVFSVSNFATELATNPSASTSFMTTYLTSWSSLITLVISVLLLVLTLLPTDTVLVRSTSNNFVKFFFRSRAEDTPVDGEY